ncbi:MAG: hypothetical protein ACLPT4_17260 [Verrucomicrobiia bacterium]
MVLFSPKARRLLDEAVRLLPDPTQRERWRGWATAHQNTRIPDGPANDDTGPLPEPIADIASAALAAMVRRLDVERRSGRVAEDDLYVLDNDISLARLIQRMIDEDQRAVHAKDGTM